MLQGAVTVDGDVPLAYAELGAGPPVVCLPGWSQAAEQFGAEGQYLSAAEKLLDTRHEAFQQVTALRGQIISFIPTIGGCGSTTVACNVSAALAKLGKTVLIDLDLMRGGAAKAARACARCRYRHGRQYADRVPAGGLRN